MKHAFTLAEVLITLLILGVVVALTIPVIMGGGPNSNKVMMKKAYTVTEKIVSSLINDPALYPERDGYYGFDDSMTIYTTNPPTVSDAAKFKNAFLDKLNITKTATIGGLEFSISSDGIGWSLTNATGWANNAQDEKYILIDANGDKKPNCRYNATTCKDPDQFRIYIQTNGRMKVKEAEDTTAADAITAHSKLRN